MEKLLIAFVSSEKGKGKNDENDDDSCHILRSSVTIGVATVGGTIGQDKGDPERHSGKGIRKVMNGIRQQTNATAQNCDDQLEQSGRSKSDQRDFERPYTPLVGLHNSVYVGLTMPMTMQNCNTSPKHPNPPISLSLSIP